MSLPPDLPPAVANAVRSAARQAFDAGARRGKGAASAEIEQVVAYALNTVAYAWIVAAAEANATAEAGAEGRHA
jgi:hypothetical protein